MVLVTGGSVFAHDETHVGFVAGVVPETVGSINIALFWCCTRLQLSKHVKVNLIFGCFCCIGELGSPTSGGTVI